MSQDEDEALFRRALEASAPEVEVPPGFAERVVALAPSRARALWRSWAGVGLAAAAVAVGAWGLAHRRVEGALEARDTIEEVRLGDRAVAVLTPGTSGRFEVGGLWGERDVLRLEHGSVFVRVEPGGPFAVVTDEGEAQVLGTCLQVTRMEDAMSGRGGARGRWFGAGVAAMGMLVVVYEGSVRVSAGRADDGGVTLGAGERALVEAGGEIRAIEEGAALAAPSSFASTSPLGSHRGVGLPEGHAPSESGAESLRLENERLRSMLERHGISAETGERDPDARRGLENPGNTDLTPEEWGLLADQGELRFRLPAEVGDRARRSAQLGDEEARALGEVMRTEQHALEARIADVYRAAMGREPEGRSLMVMMTEIEDLTTSEETERVHWMLAQERAGRRAPSAPQSEYERMMRELVAFEGSVEQRAAAQLGPERAHTAVHQSSAHGFGRSGHPPVDTAAPEVAP